MRITQMSASCTQGASAVVRARKRRRRSLPDTSQAGLNWRNLLTVVSVAILVGTEVFGAAFAGAWAIAGLFELGTTVQYGLMALFGAIGIWGMVAFVRSALVIEPLDERS